MKLAGVFLAAVLPVVGLSQTGQISVRVTDFDSGAAVVTAEVHADFNTTIEPGWGWGSGRPNRKIGHTNTNGMCTLKGSGNGTSVGVAVFKDGYYGSAGYTVMFTNVTNTIRKKWQPWDPLIEVVLKRIGTPIPMYAKRLREMQVSTNDNPVGFDSMAGD